MPEGSIGKEGPSAGTAILSAFVSLFTKTQIIPISVSVVGLGVGVGADFLFLFFGGSYDW